MLGLSFARGEDGDRKYLLLKYGQYQRPVWAVARSGRRVIIISTWKHDKSDSLDSRLKPQTSLHFATMGSDVPQFLTAVADAVENISVPVLALGTFVLCIFLHFSFGLLSKLSGSKKKKRKKGVAKKGN